MKRAALILAAIAAILTAAAAPVRTATENFVTNKIAEAVAAIPAPDYSTNNAALVETIRTKAPAPDLTAATNYTDAATSLTPVLDSWRITQPQSSPYYPDYSKFVFVFNAQAGGWDLYYNGNFEYAIQGDADATFLVWEMDTRYEARRGAIGYALGTQTNKVLASTNAVASAIASAVPAGAVVTNEYGGLEGLSAVLINGFVQADTAIIYGYVTAQGVESHGDVAISDGASLTVNGTNVMAALASKPTTNAVKSIVTETTVTGYTDWTFSGDTVPGVIYSVRDEEPTTPGSYIFTLLTNGIDAASVESSIFKPLTLNFTVGSGSITASREPITVNKLGLARLTDLADFVTHTELSTTLANMDTSYTRTIGLTNKNQTVQYVAMPRAQTELNIVLPTDGATKDWLVYVFPANDVTLRLPTATYWGTDAKVLDAMPSNTVTALYFSQVTDGVYSIGRQTLQTLDITNNTAPTEGN